MTGADTPAVGPNPAPRRSQRLTARQRLKRNRDFQATRSGGRRVDCGAFQIIWRSRGDCAPARAGVVASRAAIGNAVRRNRAKRRLREMFRRNQHLVPAGLDLILTARSQVLRVETAALEQRFVRACRDFAPRAIEP